MIYFILGLEGPHTHVVSHILKKCGLFFNENNNETNLQEYTKSSIFEPYRRHLGENESELSQDYINELYGFVRNELEVNRTVLATKEFRDYICIKYLLQAPFLGTVVYVEYNYSDINTEFLDSVPEVEYNKNLSKLNSFIDNVNQSNWSLITVNYPQFLSNSEYRTNKILEIFSNQIENSDLDSSVQEFLNNIQALNPDETVSEFDYLVSQYNDMFTTTLLDDIIENIPEADLNSDGDLTIDELKDYVENKNSST